MGIWVECSYFWLALKKKRFYSWHVHSSQSTIIWNMSCRDAMMICTQIMTVFLSTAWRNNNFLQICWKLERILINRVVSWLWNVICFTGHLKPSLISQKFYKPCDFIFIIMRSWHLNAAHFYLRNLWTDHVLTSQDISWFTHGMKEVGKK